MYGQKINEVIYRQSPKDGPFMLYTPGYLRLVSVDDLKLILTKYPWNIMIGFKQKYNADYIETYNNTYLVFKEEVQVQAAADYINGIIVMKKMRGEW